ncbi:hypothetical protein HDC94_000730 [Leifsonia sp. AK011]|uniref:hypothetical protein n=1 Tax=Leifsonia sp. AK011 TaxID=2723075 RepID=UPI0015C77974|nr:hypothetical protein [Leifsonia sp. AK011]NYF09574.1 hypothetical protein [Leifsonia sp. AK011]
MSTLRNPVGPQPASVYWRRRLVVGLGLLAVILIVVLIIVRPDSGTPTPTPAPSGSSSAAPNPDSSAPADAASGSGDVACDPTKLTLEPVTDATEYQADGTPQLWFTVKSTMTEPCTLSVGSDVQEYRITSGDELIWSSRDCQTDPVAATTVLQPGVPKEGPHITWDRTRSSTDTCEGPRDPVTAGGASYHLEVSIGDVDSTATRQFLLY